MQSQDLDINHAHAIIEYDSLEIFTAGKKAELIKFYFRRRFRVMIMDQNGLKDFQEISLPESFDPILYCHSPEKRNIGKHLTHVVVESMKAVIIRPDGDSRIQKCEASIETFKTVDIQTEKYGDYETYTYKFDSLKVGDVLEIDYTYTVPYQENIFSLITFRMFFHGDHPVLKKDLVFIKSKELEAEVTTYNADDTIITNDISTIYSWHFEDLQGCMDESGIRAYTQLPYVIFSLRPYNMIYTLPNSFVEKFVPFYVFGPARRESRHLTILKGMSEGVNSKDYILLRRFLEERLVGIPEDTTGYTQLYTVQNYIADNFKFDPDTAYFDYLDVRNERFGEFLTREVLRDRSRYNVYVGLITGLDLAYFTGYLADIRTGVISDRYFEPTISNDYLFAVLLKNGSVQFIYPKKDRFGYYLNELPFYFENTTVRLIYIDDFRYWKEPIKEKILTVDTPISSSTDNMRKQTANIEINIDDMSVYFNAAISLSGQFSTLGRGAYLYNLSDPSVNAGYSVKFWESISPETMPDKSEMGETDQDFPFKFSMNASFSANQSISVQQDTFLLDFGGWFEHILDENLNADHRVLTYYPDFQYIDSHTYQIMFNKKVKIIDRLPNIQLNNTYGNLTIKCVQKLDGSILLSSRLAVGAVKISPEKITDVYVIQEALRALNAQTVRFVEIE